MARDNATTYKVERDELKQKFTAMESDYVRVLKDLNSNDPRLIPKAKLEDPALSGTSVEINKNAPAILVGSE